MKRNLALLACLSLALPSLAATESLSSRRNFTGDVSTEIIDIESGAPNNVRVQPWLDEMQHREDRTRELLGSFRSDNPPKLERALGQWNEMIRAMHQLRNNLKEEFPNKQQLIDDRIGHQIQQALETAERINSLASALNNTDLNNSRNDLIRNLEALTGRRRRPAAAVRGAQAGSLFDQLELSLDYSYARVEDKAMNGDGSDTEGALTLIASNADFELGLTLYEGRYAVSGDYQLEQTTRGLDLFADLRLCDHFSIGSFVGFSGIDIENAVVVDPLLGTIDLGDRYDRWSAGVSALINGNIQRIEWGVTSAIAGHGEDLNDLASSDRANWINMLDASYPVHDQLLLTAYATSFTALEKSTSADGDFWLVGAELEAALDDRFSAMIGYERLLGLQDVSEDRVLLSFRILL